MSNRITLVGTKFINTSTNSETLGFRIYDNYGQTYCNTLASVPDSDLELLRIAVNDYLDEVSEGMVEHITATKCGMYINDTWYDYEEIKEYVEYGIANKED